VAEFLIRTTIELWDNAEGWGALAATEETPGGVLFHLDAIRMEDFQTFRTGKEVNAIVDEREQDSYHYVASVVWPTDESTRRLDDSAKALAAAVEAYAPGGMQIPPPPLDAIQATLDDLLYIWGGDDILNLSVSQPRPTYLSLLCIALLLDAHTRYEPVEGEFHLDRMGSVKAFTVRVGDARVPRGHPPRQVDVENRPTKDEDWEHVLRYAFD
jgi:cold shock CspA family protein